MKMTVILSEQKFFIKRMNNEGQSWLTSLNFWLEHQGQIWQVKKAIATPKTRVGEEILKDALNNTIFVVYSRLNPVLGSLIGLIEYDEIFRAEGSRYFTDPQNQRVVLKALGIIFENEIKSGYPLREKMGYEDYLPFLKGALLRLHQYEEQVQAGRGQSVNFIDSLVVIVSQEISKLRGVRNFGIGTEGIRRKIKDYLPVLREMEAGRVFMEIKEQMIRALFPKVEVKK